jgi:HflK protein
MIDFLFGVLRETWEILKDASVFLLFGFLLAGVIAVLVPGKLLTRLVGTGKVKSVLWASVLGAPLPLCSCGVLPTALGLRRQGATPGATVAFLVATPETGADSIALTYALTDPVMTVFRPIAGVATAIVAGLTTNLYGVPSRHPVGATAALSVGAANRADARDDGHPPDQGHRHDHVRDHDPGLTSAGERRSAAAAIDTTRRISHYAFVDLLDDVSYWLMLGIVLSALFAVAAPPVLFEGDRGGGIATMLLMLILSIPLYTCASSSTPMAAALALKGLSPGAILVFLLAGPATNIGGLVVLLKVLGRRAVAVYLTAVVAVTLTAGFALNAAYRAWGLDPLATFGTAPSFLPDPVKNVGALLLLALLVLSMRRTPVPPEWVWLRDRATGFVGVSLTPVRLKAAAVAAAGLLWLGSGFFMIEPGELGARLRFGRIVSSDLGPGLHYSWPWPFDTHHVISMDLVRRLEFGLPPKPSREAATRALVRGRAVFGSGPGDPAAARGAWFQKEAAPEDSFLLTGDGNLIDLRSSVQYRVKDALAYAYNLAEPDALVRSTVLAALRGVVAKRRIDAVYTTAREEVEREAREAAQARLDRYQAGIELLSVRLLYVHPPDEVHDAFRDVASAQEDKLRTINLANVFAVEKVNQAKGEAAAMMEGALAFREQRILGAQGGAAAFALRLEAYKRAPELTKFRLQLETIEEVLPGMRKFVRPGAGDVKDFDMWLLQPFGTGANR